LRFIYTAKGTTGQWFDDLIILDLLPDGVMSLNHYLFLLPQKAAQGAPRIYAGEE